MSGTITTGGLASGIDTHTIVDKLVELASRPLAQARKQQTAMRTQVSVLGDLASRLAGLDAAARGLASGGVLGTKVQSTSTSFSATSGTGAFAGSFSVQVQTLAVGAKARSAGFGAADTVTGGTLDLTVQGKAYSMTVADGAALEDVASAIRASGAPVSAVVLNDGTSRWLSVAPLETGYPPTGTPADALSLAHTATGALGKALGFATTQAASNASFTVDGLTFTRTTNTVSDALPGVTLTLKAQGGAAEDLAIATDPPATQARLQQFVDAYNGALSMVQRQLSPDKDTDRAQTLAGDTAIRALQRRLQAIGATVVPGMGAVRSLADLGLRTDAKTGALSIDSTVLTAAIARDPAAVNALFATRDGGVTAVTSALVSTFTAAGSGTLVTRRDGLTQAANAMDATIARIQARVDGYRENLLRQFTAMESAVSKIKTSGTYLTQQFAQKSSS